MDAYITLFALVGKSVLACFVLIGALSGLLALISPRTFKLITDRCNRWIDTRKLLPIPSNRLSQTLDKWVDTDRFTVAHSRLTGAVMLVGAAVLACLCFV
jgi:hypothetical protein